MDDFSATSWAIIAFVYGYMFGAWHTEAIHRNKDVEPKYRTPGLIKTIKICVRRFFSAKDDRHLEEWCKRQAWKEEQAAKALVAHGYTP